MNTIQIIENILKHLAHPTRVGKWQTFQDISKHTGITQKRIAFEISWAWGVCYDPALLWEGKRCLIVSLVAKSQVYWKSFRNIRKRKKLSGVVVSENAGFSIGWLYSFERGDFVRVQLKKLQALCFVLELDIRIFVKYQKVIESITF